MMMKMMKKCPVRNRKNATKTEFENLNVNSRVQKLNKKLPQFIFAGNDRF